MKKSEIVTKREIMDATKREITTVSTQLRDDISSLATKQEEAISSLATKQDSLAEDNKLVREEMNAQFVEIKSLI